MPKIASLNAWIKEEEVQPEDMAEMLRSVANMLEQGVTSGYYPNWELTIEEDN